MIFEKLNELLLKNISEIGYINPTPIQEKAIPEILERKDLIGIAQTGTGKTAAFVLPILEHLMINKKDLKNSSPRAVILAPTRELVQQIGEDVVDFSKNSDIKSLVVFGGEHTEIQLEQLKNKQDVLITTPTKLAHLLEQKLVDLSSVEFFVLDEADIIIESNARVDLKAIIKKLPHNKQTLLFSATFSEKIEELAKTLLNNPVKIEIIPEKVNLDLINQKVLFVDSHNKDKLLLSLLNKKEVKSSIVFVNEKLTADNLVRELTAHKIKSVALHSAKSNTHRMKVINRMKMGMYKVLIATDLASRGLDIEGITHIVNYDIPTKSEIYTHRIGRCGRAGVTGDAWSLCIPSERNFWNKIEVFIKKKIDVQTHAYHSDVAKNAKGQAAKPKHKAVVHKKKKKLKF